MFLHKLLFQAKKKHGGNQSLFVQQDSSEMAFLKQKKSQKNESR